MTTSFLIAATGLPFVGALHRFAASYGYRGVSWHQAWDEAFKVGMMLAIFSCLFIAAELYE